MPEGVHLSLVPNVLANVMMSRHSEPSQGLCLWFTGLPCAGKTTIASNLARSLEAKDIHVSILDADAVRPILSPDLGYSPKDRLASSQRLAFVARELVRHGAMVLVVTIAPFEEHRRWVRSQFAREAFAQVYVRASLDLCESRDVKGMYRQARLGRLPGFTGIGSVYEEPCQSEIVCDTERESVENCVAKLVNAVAARSWTGEQRRSA